MDLHHFFENMVRREETASAFLATLLEYDPVFRLQFLRMVTGDPTFDDSESWVIKVEARYVDITLESISTLVLIEDKINAGAKQQAQLLRYYLAAVEQSPLKRVVAVYLAPGGMGAGEVDAVERNGVRIDRPQDVVSQLPWGAIAGIIGGLPPSEYQWFARSGMAQIGAAIERARQEKYPPLGDRGLVRRVVDKAGRALSDAVPDVRIGRWSGRYTEELGTQKTPVTMAIVTAYEVDPEPPYKPVGVVHGDGLHLDIHSRFKLAGKVKRDSVLGHYWSELRAVGVVDVPGLGPHELQPDGWFVRVRPTVGFEDEVVATLAETGRLVLAFLRSFPDEPSSPNT